MLNLRQPATVLRKRSSAQLRKAQEADSRTGASEESGRILIRSHWKGAMKESFQVTLFSYCANALDS